MSPPTIPLELVNLQNVELLPNLLGISLAALAVAALAYVLVVSGRPRRRDLAVLRAIGLDSAGTRPGRVLPGHHHRGGGPGDRPPVGGGGGPMGLGRRR